MAKRRKISAVLPESGESSVVEGLDVETRLNHEGSAAAVEPAESGEDVSRLSIPVNSDNTVAWDRMRDATRERAEQVISIESGRRPAASNPAGAPAFDASVCEALYGALGKVSAALAVRALKCTPKEASIFLFSPEETALLAPITARVLDKHVGPMSDEVMLAVALGTMVTGKIAALQQMRAAAAASQPEQVAA